MFFEEIEGNEIKLKFRADLSEKYYHYHGTDLYDERGVLFNNDLNRNYLQKEFEIYQWIKADGDYVEKGEVLCIVRYTNYSNPHGYPRIGILPPIKSMENGILTVFKKMDEGIDTNDTLFQITKTEDNQNHNLSYNFGYNHFFNKYEIPEVVREPKDLKGEFGELLWKHDVDQIYFQDWLVENRSFVSSGQPIGNVGALHDGIILYTHTLKARVSGFIDQITPEFYPQPLYQDSLLCCLYNTFEEMEESIYFSSPLVTFDEFTQKKTIKWNVVGGHILPFGSTDGAFNIGAIILDSKDQNSHLMFALENHEGRDFIVFKFFKSEYTLSQNSLIQFLFEDGTVDEYEINENPVQVISPWKRLYEVKIPITQDELNNLEENDLIKWKINFPGNQNIIGGNSNEYYEGHILQKIIKKFVKEYNSILIEEGVERLPLYNKSIEKNSFESNICHVYLMYDSSNNYYKIGISNKPEYRERTLQGEKPTIELICSKDFPNRGIAASIENALHTNFSSKRIRGEWFELEQSDVVDIISTLK